jgi:transcription elongation factor GreB
MLDARPSDRPSVRLARAQAAFEVLLRAAPEEHLWFLHEALEKQRGARVVRGSWGGGGAATCPLSALVLGAAPASEGEAREAAIRSEDLLPGATAFPTLAAMSKAFVREDGEDGAGEAEPEGEEPRFGAAPRYITPEGRQRLEAELDRLWRVERPRVTHEVAEAAALGDRSENAEYIYGKRRLREIDRRVRFLAKLLEKLTVVTEVPVDRERVFFGAWVTVEDEAGQSACYRIVGPDETEVGTGRISIDSPMARALLGKRAGDDARVRRPRGETEVVVVEVRYEERG